MKELILGGARSGKSSYAQKLAKQSSKQVVYIATATAEDHEMHARIKKHQFERPAEWLTFEEPIYLADAILRHANDNCIIVDCLGLWLTNLLLKSEGVFLEEKSKFVKALLALEAPIILVSNEVGLGIVPTNELGRRFRDEIGFLHQQLGKICDQVILMVAGFPVQIK